MIKTLLDFVKDHTEAKNTYLTLSNQAAFKAAEVPDDVVQMIATGSSDPDIPSMVKTVAAKQQNLVGLINILFEAEGYDAEFCTAVRDHPEKYSIDFSTYYASQEVQILFVNEIIDTAAPAQKVKKKATHKVKEKGAGEDGGAIAFNARAAAELGKLPEDYQAILTKLLTDFSAVYGITNIAVTANSPKDIVGGKQVCFVNIFETLKSPTPKVSLLFGFIDSHAAIDAAVKTDIAGVPLTDAQQDFITTRYSVPFYITSSSHTTLFPDKSVRYDTENIIVPDGSILGTYNAMVHSTLYKNVILTIGNNPIGNLTDPAAIKALFYELIYSLCYTLHAAEKTEAATKLLDDLIIATADKAPIVLELAKSIKKDLSYPVHTLPEASLKRVLETVGPDIKKIQRDLLAKLVELDTQTLRLRNLYEEVEKLHALKLGMQLSKQDKSAQIKKVMDHIKLVLANKYVKYLRIEGQVLVVHTHPIIIKIPGGIAFDVGRLMIVIPLVARTPDQVKFYSLDRRPGGRSLPHSHDDQRVCWGNQADNILKALQASDLLSIVNIVLNYATSVNTRDGFGARVIDWPLAACSRVKKLTVDQKHKILSGEYNTEQLVDVLEIEEDVDG